MKAPVPALAARTSTERLAQFLERAECLWMASPSLAMLSLFIAVSPRPQRLLIRESSPAVLANLGRLVGAVPETAPLHEGEELRAALRERDSNPKLTMGVATHRLNALVSEDWFEAFEVRGIPTVELCVGGLFQLARRGPSAATFTVVSLDDEPAFEGARLAALLTNDSGMAQRVRDLCLSGQGNIEGSSDCLFDATPRGLADDEPALLAVMERAIAREHAEWEAARNAPVKVAGSERKFSIVWNRIFQSEPAEPAPSVPQEPDPIPAPPRGQNPWLARIAEMERQHREAAGVLNETINSVRSQGLERWQQVQAELGEWKERVQKAESQAASLAQVRRREAQSLTERLAVLESERAMAVGQRAELEGRLLQLESDHCGALRLADERAALERRENLETISRLNASLVALQSRFDAANEAAVKEHRHLETRHAAQVQRLRTEWTQVLEAAEATARQHAREAATLAERIEGFEREAVATPEERPGLGSSAREREGRSRVTEGDASHPPNRSPRRNGEPRPLPISELSTAREDLEVDGSRAEGGDLLMPEATRAGVPEPRVRPNGAGRHALPEFAPWEYERLLSRARKQNRVQTWVQGVARRLRGL